MNDQEQLTPQKKLAEVEAAWEHIGVLESGYRFVEVFGKTVTRYVFNTTDEAFLFTKEREKEIAEVRQEIAWLNCASDWARNSPEQQRILAREQAALADLLRGWRENGDGK
ncbi:MAG: hypothetical protein WBE74_13080 [Terracidiphilus sp.]